jgi:hypothetical protein
MMKILHSNMFFMISVLVIIGWLIALAAPNLELRVIDCPYKVSTRGIVHGPDSPWWSSTMPHHCFSTKRAAQEFAEEHVK